MRHFLKKHLKFSRSRSRPATANPVEDKRTAPLCYSAGQVIFEDDPYAWSVAGRRTLFVCAYCFVQKSSAGCLSCNRVNYCSDECKAKDEAFHGLECKVLGRFAIVPNEEKRLVIRALDRCIRERRATKETVGDFFGCQRTLSDLVSHSELLTGIERDDATEEAKDIFDLVRHDIETSLNEVLDLLLKCRINAHMLVDNRTPYNITQGRAIYLGASKINHSCVSTGYVQMFYGRKYILRAIRPVEIDDPLEITTHYVPANLPLERRQRHLLMNYFFICNCDKCVSQSRRSQPPDVDCVVSERITRVFRNIEFSDLWRTIGVDFLRELRHLPDTNFTVNYVLTRLQLACADKGHLEDSIAFGTRALLGTEHILRREAVLFVLCKAMAGLGWHRPASGNHHRFLETVKTARSLYAITHGGDHDNVEFIDDFVLNKTPNEKCI